MLAYGGDDTITVDGSGSKTIDGGTGSNSLIVLFSGITSLSDFIIGSVVNQQSADWTLTADNGDIITFSNFFEYVGGDFGWGDGSISVASSLIILLQI